MIHAAGAILTVVGLGIVFAWDLEADRTKAFHCYLACLVGLVLALAGAWLWETV